MNLINILDIIDIVLYHDDRGSFLLSSMQIGRFEVAIVGGGFSGAVLAVQLLQRTPGLRVALVDPGPQFGRGLAFSTTKSCHLLNVPCGSMSAFPEESDHFLEWARANHAWSTGESDFLPRGVYGRYIQSLLNDARTRCRHENPAGLQDEVVSLSYDSSGLRLRLRSGAEMLAQVAVLATGNNKSTELNIPGLSENSQRYFASAWSSNALNGIPQKGSVLFIGSGLTSVDAAAALRSEGFVGQIHMLSRHGLLPQVHKHSAVWPAFHADTYCQSVRGWLREIRREVERASAAGVDWRAVIDALRPFTQKVWQSLTIEERKRFLRHLRPYWEAHRHRMAPELGAVIHHLIHHQQIKVHAGRVKSCVERTECVEVHFKNRGSGRDEALRVDRVINCTGPECDFRRIDSPLFRSLFDQGLARPDGLRLGLDVDREGRLLNRSGEPSRSLYAIGPVRKGNLWETTAVPEIRVQAAQLARLLADSLKDRQTHPESALRDAGSDQRFSSAGRPLLSVDQGLK